MCVLNRSLPMVAKLGVPRRVPGSVGLQLYRLLNAQSTRESQAAGAVEPQPCLPSLHAHGLQLWLAPQPWVQLAVHGSFRNLYVRDIPQNPFLESTHPCSVTTLPAQRLAFSVRIYPPPAPRLVPTSQLPGSTALSRQCRPNP